MSKILILITSRYPFGKTESFLEGEISYLSESFEHIYLIPSKYSYGEPTRSIPQNFTLINSLIEEKNISRFQRQLRKISSSLLTLFFWKEFPKALFSLSFTAFDSLLTYSWDVILTNKILHKLSNEFNLIEKDGIIYTYWWNGTTLGAIHSKLSYPVISRTHGSDLYEELHPGNYLPFRYETLKKINKLFPVSSYGKNYLDSKYPEFSRKVELSRLGIELPDVHSIPDTKKNKFNTVSCSSVNINKRVDIIADSLVKVSKENPDIFIEWNHFGDGPLLESIKSKLNDIPDNLVINFHGFVLNSELMNWYLSNNPDLFINLSLSEGIPVSIMEAYGHTIPAIATRVGGTQEIVNHNNGWLIESDTSYSEVANYIEEAVRETEKLNEKSKQARETCEEYYDSAKNYPDFISKIKSLIL